MKYYSVFLDDTSKELTELGYNIRRVINVQHPKSKPELHFFFIHMETTKNCRDIFK